MEQIIEKAKLGGFNPSYTQNTTYSYQNEYQRIILDSFFWQALNRSCGWAYEIVLPVEYISNNNKKEGKTVKLKTKFQKKIVWQYYALRFHEINLTEGWQKAIKYLSDLTTS